MNGAHDLYNVCRIRRDRCEKQSRYVGAGQRGVERRLVCLEDRARGLLYVADRRARDLFNDLRSNMKQIVAADGDHHKIALCDLLLERGDQRKKVGRRVAVDGTVDVALAALQLQRFRKYIAVAAALVGRAARRAPDISSGLFFVCCILLTSCFLYIALEIQAGM